MVDFHDRRTGQVQSVDTTANPYEQHRQQLDTFDQETEKRVRAMPDEELLQHVRSHQYVTGRETEGERVFRFNVAEEHSRRRGGKSLRAGGFRE